MRAKVRIHEFSHMRRDIKRIPDSDIAKEYALACGLSISWTTAMKYYGFRDNRRGGVQVLKTYPDGAQSYRSLYRAMLAYVCARDASK
jgi:hypothetical protein